VATARGKVKKRIGSSPRYRLGTKLSIRRTLCGGNLHSGCCAKSGNAARL
jgi:hypothetical protein